ncbi:prolyl oligopeptidase [Crossiella equi]|uniref:prolyl oligopeptidase n=1 Tax=Crossiella equi TaxID=130796 RepID=A0ABS5AD13_9PSEU|nr:prolyl oligopeptidase family serine peptidase [Crossiella equi]MBP2474231.1 prolyl oligopeptidase [Crossiella equi]
MTEQLNAPFAYPPAERLDLVEQLHGHQVADPYRWLEDAADERTTSWSLAQDALARPLLDALPGREAIADRVSTLLQSGSVSAPFWRNGRAFFTRRLPGQEHAVLHVREADGSERALLDVASMDPSGLTTLDYWVPSLEGDKLAYLLSTGGDEESQLHIVDVATGTLLDGPIDRARNSPVAWLPGGEELFYVRRLAPDAVPEGEELFHRRVWRHRVGADPSVDELVHGEGLDKTNYYGVRVSADGRWLVVDATPGTAPKESVWIADLAGDGKLRQIMSEVDSAYCTAWVERDGRLYLLTTLGSPRWRLCVADPAEPGQEHWRELVAEDEGSVLETARWLAGRLVVLRSRHAVSEVHLHDPATGEHLSEIPLPGTGTIHGLSTVDSLTTVDTDVLWLGWADFTSPSSVHRHQLSTGVTELVESAPGTVTVPEVHTRQVAYTSKDGTTVRMFVLSPTATPDRPRPTLLGGYGGFSISYSPSYSASALAWVEAGGVYALASLRGGGEEGEDWHQGGMRANKQNTFDDFHAAAEHLIAEGWTTSPQLAVQGGSNGGLLMGAALTQRPDLYRVVVCSAPLLDMVRYEEFLIGRIWNDEYGTAADPAELEWLLSYSPYHHVRPGTEYPAVLFTVFESDSRVDPCHARKMCAALQAATASPTETHPVLFRRETDVGHSTRSISRTVSLTTDTLSFLASRTGLVFGDRA